VPCGEGHPRTGATRESLQLAAVPADNLNDRFILCFDEHDIRIDRILTDRGSEYCGAMMMHTVHFGSLPAGDNPMQERLLWMAPALQEKFDVLASVGSSLLFGLLMQSTLDWWP
jgi:hypothetical protein